ncbi:gene transfer agent family protein [Pararhizobium mangrovi]|uniref:Gene transfer agent family protein n=1 Tax=Pararhizobium mangrovi TaxID=2590452 RepID=A0A506TWD2_9HYPH|nr:gene transfer agent family protein [Pararhizobium mangrovi]TPW26382.1 gene transfer agent family protein [Pararhizobium mangrovi]
MTISTMQFFGDAERAFALPMQQLVELERKLGCGAGAILNRLVAHQYAIADLVETIRLGLIGGGTSPFEAEALVVAYAHDRPLAEILPVALAVLEARFFGTAAAQETPSDE